MARPVYQHQADGTLKAIVDATNSDERPPMSTAG